MAKILTGVEGSLLLDYDTYPVDAPEQKKVQQYLDKLIHLDSVKFSVGRVPKGGLEIMSAGVLIWSLEKEGYSEEALELLAKRLAEVKNDSVPKNGYYNKVSLFDDDQCQQNIISDNLKYPSPHPNKRDPLGDSLEEALNHPETEFLPPKTSLAPGQPHIETSQHRLNVNECHEQVNYRKPPAHIHSYSNTQEEDNTKY